MLIDFEKMEAKVVPHMRGGEKEAVLRSYQDGLCKIIRGRLIPGGTVGLHTHVTDSETIYILSGRGKVLYDRGYEPLSAGSCHYCPRGHEHSLINDSDEDLIFFAVIPEHGA